MILVTGGTGLVGAHLLLLLAENNDALRAIYREPSSIEKTKSLFLLYNKEGLFSKIEWVQGDIIDVPSLETAFKNVTYVYHCAALISYDPDDENELRKTNIEGTANIVNFSLAYNIKKLCHVSSIAALGDLAPNETEITEETEWNPEVLHSDYAISKYGAEMEIWRGKQEGLNIVVVNPGIILGPGFWKQGSGVFFTEIKKGFPFYTKGISAYVGVIDVVNIMVLLMQSSHNSERYTLISENVSYEKIITQIAEKFNTTKPKLEAKPWLLGIAWRIDWMLSTLFRTKRKLSKYSAQALCSCTLISNDKIKNALHYEFQSIDEVIKECIDIQQ
jgi:nucleoside-diphosphate-sugar epimerase